MAETFKKLAQGQLAASSGTLYTASGVTTIIKSIVLVNDQIADRAVTLTQDGTGDTKLITPNGFVVPGNAMANFDGMIVVDASGTIRGFADVANDVTYTIYGVEIA